MLQPMYICADCRNLGIHLVSIPCLPGMLQLSGLQSLVQLSVTVAYLTDHGCAEGYVVRAEIL